METNLLEMAGTLLAAVLTLFVFSYLLGDNLLYRLAEHLFVGVALGYAVVVAFHTVLTTKLFLPMAGALGQRDWERTLLLAVPLVLGLLLFTRRTRALSWLGNLGIAVLVGVGSALAIGGALLGTLLPQVDATADVTHYVSRYGPGLGLFSGILALAGTTGVVLHFYFARGQTSKVRGLRDALLRSWGGLGHWFIVIAFGAILATTFVSRLSLLIGRIQFLLDTARRLLGG